MTRGLYPAPDDEEPPVSVSAAAASLPRADAPLKACPFCGGDVDLQEDVTLLDYPDTHSWWAIACENSGCSMLPTTGWVPNREDAIAAWNRRDGEDARIAEAVRVARHSQLHDVFEVLRWAERHGGRVARSGIYLRGENDGDRFSSGGIGDDTFERAVMWIREQQAKERPE